MDDIDIRRSNAITPDGVGIAYQMSGSGPALICGHAMGMDHSMYDRHRASFSQAHTMITFDQRGSGMSDHPPFEEGEHSAYTVERFGDDLKAALDDAGVEKAMILGFSMGAVSALSFATRWPERVDKLILASAMASRLPQPIIDRARQVEDMLEQRGVKETHEFYFSGPLFEGLIEQESTREQIVRGGEQATAHGFKGCFRVTIDRPSLVEHLHVIDSPTLIMVGETDTHYLAEAELLEREIKGAKRVVMPGVGHAMCAQRPEQFESTVLEFIA